MKVLLVSATYPEIAPFVERLNGKIVQNNIYSGSLSTVEIHCLITGIGIAATTYALTKYIQNTKYDLIVNAGIAGSYKESLKTGDVVMVSSDCFGDLGIDNNGTFHSLFEEQFLKPDAFPFHKGNLVNPFNFSFLDNLTKVKGVTMNTASGSREKIDIIKNKFHGDVETMEGAAFMYTCLMESIPFVQIRAVSNQVEPRNRKNWNISLAITNLTSTLIDIFTSEKFKI